MAFPDGSDGKESAFKAGDLDLIPGFRKIPWRKKWLLTPVFLPGEPNRQRSLVDHCPQSHRAGCG